MALNPDDPRHVITAESFGVSPALLGAPLAGPWRRLWAMALDGILVAILASTGAVVLGGLAAVTLFKASRSKPESTGFVRAGVRGFLRLTAAIIAFVVVANVAGGCFGNDGDDDPNPRDRTEAAAALEEAGVDADDLPPGVAGMLEDAGVPLNGAEEAPAEAAEAPLDSTLLAGLPADLAARVGALDSAHRALREERNGLAEDVADLRDEVDGLERDLERAEGASFVSSIKRFVDEDLGIGFGWGALYFTGFLALWNGRTPGKRALGIRVIRLDGRPVSWWIAFERFGGYAASAAVGLLGFAQLLWDRNRQGLHDKAVETVVVRDIPRSRWHEYTGGASPFESMKATSGPRAPGAPPVTG